MENIRVSLQLIKGEDIGGASFCCCFSCWHLMWWVFHALKGIFCFVDGEVSLWQKLWAQIFRLFLLFTRPLPTGFKYLDLWISLAQQCSTTVSWESNVFVYLKTSLSVLFAKGLLLSLICILRWHTYFAFEAFIKPLWYSRLDETKDACGHSQLIHLPWDSQLYGAMR